MGLLKIIKAALNNRTSSQLYTDRIWVSESAKFAGLGKHILESPASHRIWVLAHFEESLNEIKAALDELNVSYDEAHSAQDLQHSNSEVLVTRAATVEEHRSLPFPSAKAPDIVFVIEHYPTFGRDDELVVKLKEISPENQVYYYVALSEPFFNNKLLKIETTFEQFNISEDECLEHPWLTKSIRNAQQRIAREAGNAVPANSQEEWFDNNLS